MSTDLTASPSDVRTILKQTSKGRLVYDRDWHRDGREQGFISDMRSRLISLTISPKDCLPDPVYEDISPPCPIAEEQSTTLPSTLSASFDSPLSSEVQKQIANLEMTPEEAQRYLKEYEEERKATIDQSIKIHASLLLQYLRDSDREKDSQLRQVRTKHTNLAAQRYEEQKSSVLNSFVHSKSPQTSPYMTQKLQEVDMKKKQHELAKNQRMVESEKRHRCEEIQDVFRKIEADISSTKEKLDKSKIASFNPEFIKDKKEDLDKFLNEATIICKQDHPTSEDVTSIRNISKNVVNVAELIINEAKSLMIQRKELLTQQANVSQGTATSQPVKSPEKPKQSVKRDPSSIVFLKEYIGHQQRINGMEEKLKPFVEEKGEVKLYRQRLQTFIRTQINAISPESNDHLKKKFQMLQQLFDGNDIKFQDKLLSTRHHPLAMEFCASYAAKTLLSVGCKQVQSVPKSSFPIAAVTVLLWEKNPFFGQLFLSYLFEKCPYLIYYYPSPEEGESEVDHLIASGYVYGPDNQTLESEESFLNRMRSFARIYGAIIASKPEVHPYGLRYGWLFLAQTLSLNPRPGVTPAILHAFLSVTIHRFQLAYKSQFLKMLNFVNRDYIPRIEQSSEHDLKKQSVVQLKLLVEDVLKKIRQNQSLKPEGVLSEYFWQKSFLNSK